MGLISMLRVISFVFYLLSFFTAALVGYPRPPPIAAPHDADKAPATSARHHPVRRWFDVHFRLRHLA